MPRILRVAALSALALVVASIAELPASMQELEIATSVSLLEGPTVDAEGNVYFTDILMQRIMRFSKTGEFSVFRDKSNVANGLVIDSQGRLVAAEGAGRPLPAWGHEALGLVVLGAVCAAVAWQVQRPLAQPLSPGVRHAHAA